jgi:hypothetical protein
MAGLVKAKKYDFKDTNMELVGSDVDRAVRSAVFHRCVSLLFHAV